MNRRAKNILGLALMAGSVLALVGMNLLAGIEPRQESDPTEVPEGAPARHLVILLDVTDPYSADQIAALARRLQDLERRDLAVGEVVSLWGLGRFPGGELVRVFHKRFPGRAADALRANPELVSARCDSAFSVPLERATQVVASSPSAPITQIHAALRELVDVGALDGGRVRLFLISDLGETGGGHVRFPTIDLRGVTLEVVEVARPRSMFTQRANRRALWRGYLARCGAASVSFQRL